MDSNVVVADDAFYGPEEKRQKLDEDDLKKLYETDDDGEKKLHETDDSNKKLHETEDDGEKKLYETDDDGEKKLYETDDDGEKKLHETDDSDKKQELDEDDDFDYGELEKRFFGEPDLSWMKKNRQMPTHPQKEEYVEVEHDKVEYVYSDDEEQVQKSLRQHLKQVKESRGFDVDEFPDIRSADILGIIMPLLNFSECPKTVELLNTLSDLAITSYNQENDTRYKFVNVQKANSQVAVGVICYITFEAKSDDDDQPKIFQAKVLAGLNKEHQVYSCWPKSTP